MQKELGGNKWGPDGDKCLLITLATRVDAIIAIINVANAIYE